MKITCEINPTRKSILTISIDGEPWRDVHTSIFGKCPQLPQNCQTYEEFISQFSAFESRQVKNYCLRRLSLQAMLSTALASSLKERFVSEIMIQQMFHELNNLGFLNDREWSASFVRMQTSRKVGPHVIAKKLASKGIKGEELEKALEKSWNSDSQKKQILSLLKTRYAKRNLTDFKEKQKVIASLVRKGFKLSIILDIIQTPEKFHSIEY
jgi:regulatory protein